MGLKERIGLNFPPILLRLMLATIFIWAGLGKVLATMQFDGAEAATLANLGVITPETPGDSSAPAPGRTYAAADFPDPVDVLRLHGLTLRIYDAANPPAVTADGDGASRAYWPAPLGERPWPTSLAWAVAFTELIGGFCLLLGLLTRFWAFGVAGVMLGAIWLTQLGPAIQTGETVLGFLPAYERFSPAAWQALMFQFSLLTAALALAFLGAGRASIDHALFGPARDEDDDDED